MPNPQIKLVHIFNIRTTTIVPTVVALATAGLLALAAFKRDPAPED